MANRLAGESSPYLLQHQDNPVDWYPWGEEAFDKAKSEDKPVFLSIGYSSCHWCHVMAHESFEDEGVAEILNQSFVSVKVDREERPDVDEAYMTAVQLSSGRGGWPMTVFLTPDKKPFFAGTYFPRDDRDKYPGFRTICAQIAMLWKEKRQELEENASEFAIGLQEALARPAPITVSRFDESFLADAVRTLASDFDNKHGGFGDAPKFPPHTSIDFLLRYVHRDNAPEDLRQLAIGMALSTLEQMALGGIHDHVGGGFHRYSTDSQWLLPHFEKMLYDNALMLGNYALAAAMVHDVDPQLEGLLLRAANGIAAWTIVEMTTPEGLFCSAIDADSEGEEGRFYVWTSEEIRDVLGDRAEAFLKAFQFDEGGNFEDEATGRRTGANIPHLSQPQGDAFAQDLNLLRERRSSRVRPSRDDKALVSWNGLMIAALAQAGLLDQAEKAALAILDAERRHDQLPHQIMGDTPSGCGFLDDYASFAWALLQLGQIRRQFPKEGTRDWTVEGTRLTVDMIRRFWDEAGGFFGTSEEHESLFGRTKPVFDSPTPSANAIALRCLLATGDEDRSQQLLSAMLGWMERAPQATEALYAAAMPLASSAADEPVVEAAKPAEVAVRMEPKEIVADGEEGRGEVVLSIPPGLHLNSHTPPARWLTPTCLSFQPISAEIDYPAGADDAYEGEVRIPFRVKLPTGSRGEEFEIRVTFQPCTDTECLLPVERVLTGVLVRSR